MIRKVIITQDGVKIGKKIIPREIVLKWIKKTKNNIVPVCAEGETVELTPDEYLQCCFINNEAEQIDLINYALKNEQKR